MLRRSLAIRPAVALKIAPNRPPSHASTRVHGTSLQSLSLPVFEGMEWLGWSMLFCVREDTQLNLSPEGPDKGIDILAAPEPMGFGEA